MFTKNLRTFLQFYIFFSISLLHKVEGTKTEGDNEKAVIYHCVVGRPDDPIARLWKVPAHLSSTRTTMTVRVRPQNQACDIDKVKEMMVSSNDSSLAIENVDFLPNGYFHNGLEYYHPMEYCVNRVNEAQGGILVIRYCNTEVMKCTNERPCSSKCCPLDRHFLDDFLGCQPLDLSTSSSSMDYLQQIPHYNVQDKKLSSEQLKNAQFHYNQGAKLKSRCNESGGQFNPSIYTDNQGIHHGFKLHLNGELSVCNKKKGKWHKLNTTNFCVDEHLKQSRMAIVINFCTHGLHEEDIDPEKVRNLIFGILLVIASLFSLLTFIVYLCIMQQRTVHGWITMSLSATMFFAYIFLSTSYFIKFREYHENSTNTNRCRTIGALTHFFFLGIFSWLTAVCFDLWWTFRTITPTNKGAKSLQRYILHALFGWGVPFLIVVLGIILQESGSCNVGCESTCVIPGYGEENCFLADHGVGYYLYLPAGILLAINVLFFASTFYKLYHYKKSTKIALQNTNPKRQMLSLCLKLFFVMGIPWCFEVISWLCSGGETTSHQWYWYIPDILNICQPLAIFIIFTCKRETLEGLRKVTGKFRTPKTDPTNNEKETTVTLTSTKGS